MKYSSAYLASAVACTLAAANPSQYNCQTAKVKLNIVPSPGAVITNNEGVVWAAASAIFPGAPIYDECGDEPTWFDVRFDSFGDIEIMQNGEGGANAAVGAGNFAEIRCVRRSAAFAKIEAIDATWEIELETESCMGLCDCRLSDDPVIYHYFMPVGMQWAIAGAVYTFSMEGSFTINAESESSTDSDGGQIPPDAPCPIRYTPICLKVCEQMYLLIVIESCNGSYTIGLQYDPITDTWVRFDGNITGNGSCEIEVCTASFHDGAMDINGDGRFNGLDVGALVLLIGETPDSDTPWDFNASGLIDQGDVDLLQAIFDAGADNGVLGDLDGDLDFDCDDYASIDTADFGFNLGQSGFIFALDANLDGKTDASDYATIVESFPTADFNSDGFVTGDDFDAYIDAFDLGDPSADFNHDGFVTGDDLDAYLIAYAAGC